MTLECFRYEDLVRDEAGDLHAVAERAFGHHGLGIVVVTGVPDIARARRELFALGHKFAALPEETKARYEHPQSSFSFGWSHGKESLETGRPDLAKGSFYANPCFDEPFGGDGGGSGSDSDSGGGGGGGGAGSGEDGDVDGRSPNHPLHRRLEKGDDGHGRKNASEEGGGGSGGGNSGPKAETAAALVAKYPSFAHPNVWPDADVPEFSTAFKALGRVVVRVGGLVARQCDRYVATVHPGYETGKISRIVSTSRCPKGRLLYYFPRSSPPPERTHGGVGGGPGDGGKREVVGVAGAVTSGGGGGGGGGGGDDVGGSGEEDDRAFSDWCGWHNDHSALTGLVPAMFLDGEGREVANEDPRCGLYVRSRRKGELVKATLPPGEAASSCLLFQIGETTQVLSGGALQATPHAVRSTSQEGVSREAFAVFMQPEWGESMDVPRGTELESVRSLHSQSLLPRAAAPITDRLRPGMDFGEFTEATFAAYY